MMQKHKKYHKILHMRLTDRFLLMFLSILLIQSSYYIFFSDKIPIAYESMDAMIRSSTATIFGYFISAAFGGEKNAPPEFPLTVREEGFVIQSEKQRNESRIRQQIVIVAGIGFFSLVVLFYARIHATDITQSEAVLAQFQDFLVASIGFLVGHAKHDI